jgi:hypothetical protein
VGGEEGGLVGGGEVRMQPVCIAFTINLRGHEAHLDAFALEYSPIGHFEQILRTRSA